jgi:hypothetical protein
MKKNKGSIIVFALIVLAFILIAAFSVAAVTLVERRSANVSVNSSTAFQNADKGMEEFLQQLYKELDQNDTLDDIADEINALYGSGYICDTSTNPTIPANIGDEDTEFIITAFREASEGVVGDDVAGWRSVTPITDCTTPLADVARFKVAGNFNNAVRAVFLKLRDSLSRGLVAKWSFEDRAQVARVVSDSDREKRISYIAQDASKQFHTLTLCNIRSDEEPTIKVLDQRDGSTENYEVVSFDGCDFDSADGMSPLRGYVDSAMGHEEDDLEYDEDHGAWTEGIVQEELSHDGAAHGDTSSQEALRFDGTTYLAMNTESGCATDAINCVSDEEDLLDNIENGLSISLWINPDNLDVVLGVGDFAADEGWKGIVSYFEHSKKGFRIVQREGGKVAFYLRKQEFSPTAVLTEENSLEADEWTHIVATWRKEDKMRIYVNGKEQSDTKVFNKENIFDGISDKTPFLIGALSSAGEDQEPDFFFEGKVDDVRIWNRALTEEEVCRLCKDAGTEAQDSICDSSC